MATVALAAIVGALGGSFSDDLREFYASWWFRALLAGGGVAMAACGLRSFIEMTTRLVGRGLGRATPPGTVLIAGIEGLTPELVARHLRQSGYRVGRWDGRDGRVVEGVKGWLGWGGRALVHCGLATVLLGGLFDALHGWTRTETISRGGNVVLSGKSTRRLSLVADSLAWGPGPGRALLRATRDSARDSIAARWITPATRWTVAGVEILLQSVQPSPRRFASATVRAQHADGWERTLELVPGEPAPLRDDVLLTAMAYVAGFQEGVGGAHGDMQRVTPRRPAVHLRVASSEAVSAVWALPGETPLGTVGPWSFALQAVVPHAEALLELRTRPGDPLLAGGLVAFVVGTVCAVAFPLRRVWAVFDSTGTSAVGAHGPLSGRGWREEIGRLSRELARLGAKENGWAMSGL